MISPWAASVLLLVSGASLASFGTQSNGAQILREQRQITEQTEGAYGKYSHFSPEALERLTMAQRTIFDLLGDSADLDRLSMEQKVKVFNAVEVVRAVINDNEADRLVCERESRVGTAMRTTVCATVAERKAVRDDSKEWKGRSTVCTYSQGHTGCATRD